MNQLDCFLELLIPINGCLYHQDDGSRFDYSFYAICKLEVAGMFPEEYERIPELGREDVVPMRKMEKRHYKSTEELFQNFCNKYDLEFVKKGWYNNLGIRQDMYYFFSGPQIYDLKERRKNNFQSQPNYAKAYRM